MAQKCNFNYVAQERLKDHRFYHETHDGPVLELDPRGTIYNIPNTIILLPCRPFLCSQDCVVLILRFLPVYYWL